ncbi:MAG TPA: hypothetical protein PK156_17560 [Polyangium sp.]|nr:hypothetical protein [Polyangium sp.]
MSTFALRISLLVVNFAIFGCTSTEFDELDEFDDGKTTENEMVPDDESINTGTSEDALWAQGRFDWYQGWNAVRTGETNKLVCFLARMQGKFEGWGESVYTFTSGSDWYLGGRSQQADVAGASFCAETLGNPYTGEYWWEQGYGNSWTSMVPTTNANGTRNVCFLTRVQGRFYGTGEWVEVLEMNGWWYLRGASQQTAVGAGARCVTLPAGSNYSAEYSWEQGWLPTVMGTTTNRSCGLTYVRGNFRGGGERVEIVRTGGTWYLQGSSYQNGVRAKSRCF